LVPRLCIDQEVQKVAQFRSKSRLPALSWFDGVDHGDNPDGKGPSHAAILRCAQPLVGITGKKSPHDERLFHQVAVSDFISNLQSRRDSRTHAVFCGRRA
jgi:hypothetical protein